MIVVTLLYVRVRKVKETYFYSIRIIPLTVVVYRVLMVCHVEFCYNHGEKVLRDTLFRFDPPMINFTKLNMSNILRLCLVFSVVVGLMITHVHNSLRSYLICSEREEFLRFNLEDFWSPAPYDGSSFTSFPEYHPFKILSWSLCKYWKIP